MNLNTVSIVGEVVAPPEMSVDGTSPVAEFDVVLRERVKVDDEWTTRRIRVGIIVWGKQGAACGEHLRKGSLVGIAGRLGYMSREWNDDTDLRVIASAVQFLSRLATRPADAVEEPVPV